MIARSVIDTRDRRIKQLLCVLLMGAVWAGLSNGHAQLRPEQVFPDKDSSCQVCHGKEKTDYQGSIHERRGFTCVDCHGGNAQSLEEKKAHAVSAGFKPKPDKKGTVQLCASCHSDVRMMTPFGLPTDQFSHYQISAHGIGLFTKNDTKVAICTDCHQTHATRPHTDPQSATYTTNVPRTCAKCHADATLMQPYGIPTDPYEKYAASVHGKALLEQENTQSPNCSDCHSSHGAAPPGVTDVSKVCGKCHDSARDYFEQSPHKTPMAEQKMSECTSCHNHHDTASATLEHFDSSCGKCHEAGTNAFRSGQEMKALLAGAESALNTANRIVDEAKAQGLSTADYEFTLAQAYTDLLRARPITHALNMPVIQELTERSKGAADRVKLDIHNTLESQKVRRIGLGVIWLMLFPILVALFWRLRRANKA